MCVYMISPSEEMNCLSSCELVWMCETLIINHLQTDSYLWFQNSEIFEMKIAHVTPP